MLILVLKDNILENKQKIWKHLFGIFPTFDAFNEVFTQCTENYGCLVLNGRSTSNKIEETVFWYKAKPNRKFKIYRFPDRTGYLGNEIDLFLKNKKHIS